MGVNYSDFRRPDPRIEAAIWNALGDARSVVNVGAGTGSYEPTDREVVAVEPSPVMIAQRPPGAAPALEGVAESLPLDDKSVDAAMGVLTIHHWQDLDAGLIEMRRVARRRIVLLTIDAETVAESWIVDDYFPEAGAIDREVLPSMTALRARLPGARIGTVPVPRGCLDGFTIALWDRPELILDPEVRRASSIWHLHAAQSDRARGLERLRGPISRADAGTRSTVTSAPGQSWTSACAWLAKSCERRADPRRKRARWPGDRGSLDRGLFRRRQRAAGTHPMSWPISTRRRRPRRTSSSPSATARSSASSPCSDPRSPPAPSPPRARRNWRGSSSARGARRRGIGRALAERCAELARAEGWPAIALWSRPYQVAGHRLYESLDYRRRPRARHVRRDRPSSASSSAVRFVEGFSGP